MPTTPWDPMRNNNKKLQNESTAFPGITKDAEAKILATAEKQGKTQYERNLIANDLYKVALKEQNNLNFINERTGAKQELYQKSLQSKDKNQSNRLRTTERTAEVADMIRNYSKTNGYGDLDQWEDIDIINGFTNENKETRNEIEDYINGEESAFSFSNRMGFGAGDNRSRFDMITRNGGEWNDDILGHFETESYDNADNKVGTWFKNLGKSTYNLASDLTNMVVNPVDTIGNLTKAAVGGVMNLTGLDDNVGDEGWFAEANQVADGMGDFLKDRYGGKEQILNTFYQDPAGLISDIASIVAGGAGLAKGGATAVAKTAATTGAKSVARNVGKVANVAGKVMRTANNLDPATIILKGEGNLAKGAYKGAKGVVNAVTSPIETGRKVLNSAGEGLDKIGEYGAKKITGTTSAQDKLYKAQEPRMNILTRKKDLEKRRVNSDRANELIVENGYKPTDTASRLTAHEATMKKIWNEVEKRVNNDEAVGINQSQLAEKLYDYIKDQKKLGSSLNKADIAALEREMKSLNGKIIDLPTLEKKKQLYNSIINNWGESKVSDVFSNGLKVLTHEIGKIEDSILAEIPGEFQKLKNDFGALKDTYEDVFKADMKNQRKKGLGLVETYSRLEGLGDIASGVLSIFNGGAKDIAKGAGKLVMGKALAKARDVDFLVKEGFEDLYNSRKGLTENQVSSKTAKYQVAEPEYEYIRNRNDLPGESYLVVNQIITRINGGENIKSVIKDTLEGRERMLERYERILKNGDETGDYGVIGEYQLKRQIEKYKNDISVLKTMDESDFGKKAQDPLKSIAVDKTGQKSLGQQVNELRTLGLDEATIDKYVQDVIANPEKAEKITINTMKQAKNYIVWQEPKKGAENVRVGLDKPKGGWTKSEIRNTLKNIEADKGTDAIYKAVNEYDDVDDFMAHAFYHGTAHYFAGKPSITLSPSEAMRLGGGGYGERYYAISLSKNKKIASNFGSQEAGGGVSIYPVLLKKNAKVIELPKTTDSIDLNDFITKLWDDGIDAVWIGDKNAGEQELAILNPKAIVNTQKSDYYKMFGLGTEKNPINIKDRAEFEKMYNDVKNATTEEEKAASANNIMYQKYGTAGSNEKEINATKGLNIRNFKNGKTVQQLADQYGIKTKIVDKISTPEGQKAYGVYGDRMITLAKDLVESTVPHELLHATFDMVDTAKRKSLLDGIQKRLNVDDVQAEEWLADRFSEYYRKGVFDAKNVPNTLVGQIKEFFKQVKEYIDGTYANRKEIQRLFDDIIDGKLEGEYGVYSDPKFQSVWHGSPADFDKFDSSHMGEGEGAQAHGWGHYVAVEERTGRHYADMGGKSEIGFRGRRLREIANDIINAKFDGTKYDVEEGAAAMVLNQMDNGYDFKKAKEYAINNLNELIKDFEREGGKENKIKEYQGDIKAVETLSEKDFNTIYNRNLYNVEIPDPKKADTPTGKNYLDEEYTLNEKEANRMADAIDKYAEKNKNSFEYKDPISKWRFERGEIDANTLNKYTYDNLKREADILRNAGMVRGNILVENLQNALGDKGASKFLESLGYDGIHYFGGRDGEAYVIFNDDALKINRHEKY